MLTSALFVGAGVDDPDDDQFGLVVASTPPATPPVVYAKPRDDLAVPTGN